MNNFTASAEEQVLKKNNCCEEKYMKERGDEEDQTMDGSYES